MGGAIALISFPYVRLCGRHVFDRVINDEMALPVYFSSAIARCSVAWNDELYGNILLRALHLVCL